MATKHLSPTSVPRHIIPLLTTPLPPPRVLSSLQTFLTSPPNLAPDVIYQLHEFQKSVEWQVANHIETVKAEAMTMDDLDFGLTVAKQTTTTTKKQKREQVAVSESSRPLEGREKSKKKKEGKDGKKKGSKWN